MIEDPPLLQIRRRFSRPTDAEVDVFRGLQTGYVVDAMNGRGAMDGRIKPVAGSAPFCGVALTCHAGPADNLAVFGALSIAQRGDVIVCAADSFAETAVTGDLLLGMLQNRGVTAFVTDGFVRDVPGIVAVGLPCYAAGITPNSPARNGPGTVGLPVVVGGVAVSAGDIVIGDQDGVVIVPGSLIAAAARRLPAIRAAEADLDAKVKAGLQVPGFIQDMIDAGRFSEID
jgi:4-hydroxy-4-methyl-2-oxoglutarate aldolase